jgi:hypothetical protein
VHPKITVFSLSKKITNEFQKNINFGLLIDFDMNIRLSDLNRSFLTTYIR